MLPSSFTKIAQILLLKIRRRQEIPYLKDAFPDELEQIVKLFSNQDLDPLSKVDLKYMIERRVLEGVPFFRKVLVPTYLKILQICAKRLQIWHLIKKGLPKELYLYDTESNIINKIQEQKEKNLPILIRPWLLSRLIRIDPSNCVMLLPHLHKIHDTTRKRIVIGVVGSPSAGKDTALRAIFGIDTGNILPIAGSTKSIEIYEYQNNSNILVVNTPGMGDVSQKVTQQAVDTLENIGIYLYLLNSEGGLQAREYDDLKICIDSGKPVLVILNKIDCLREKNRNEFIDSVRKQLPKDTHLIPSCLDPLPGLMEPMGIEESRILLAQNTKALLVGNGLIEEAQAVEKLFVLPAPKPTPHEMKTVTVEPSVQFEGVAIRNIFSSPKDIIKQHPIAALFASSIFLFLLALPFIIISIPIILISIILSGLIQLGDFAKETVEEKVQDIQQGLVLPEFTNTNAKIELSTDNKMLTYTVEFEGPNIDTTVLHYKWIQTSKDETSKTIADGNQRLSAQKTKVTLQLPRKKAKRDANVFVQYSLHNIMNESPTSSSPYFKIPNSPIENLYLDVFSNKKAQMGDILTCRATAKDLDLELNKDEVQYSYKWFDEKNNLLEETNTINTCAYPDTYTFRCRVDATDGESHKTDEGELKVAPLIPSSPKKVFAIQIKRMMDFSDVQTLNKLCKTVRGYKEEDAISFQSWFSTGEKDSPYTVFERSADPYIIDTIKKEGNKNTVLAKDWCALTTRGIEQPIPLFTFDGIPKLEVVPDLYYRTDTDMFGRYKKMTIGTNKDIQKEQYWSQNSSIPFTQESQQKAKYIYCFQK